MNGDLDIKRLLLLAIKENPIRTIGWATCFLMFIIGIQSENEFVLQVSFIGALGTFLIPFFVSRKSTSNETTS
jgi:ABC-type Fe3+-siderophore transport system permease subunit